jgi:hypothetical protein
MLPFVMPALYGAKAISTGLAALGLGATFLPPAIDFRVCEIKTWKLF